MQTNLFGKDLLNKMNTGGNGTKISKGIHSKIKLKDIEITDTYVDIWFENPEDGKTINKRLWIPDINKTTAKEGMSVQETIELRVHQALYHLLDLSQHMIGTETTANIPIGDLKSTAAAIRTLLMPYSNSKFLNLKVVTTQDGKYPEISNFVGYLEPYVEGKEPTLEFKPSELSRMHQSSIPDMPASDTTNIV